MINQEAPEKPFLKNRSNNNGKQEETERVKSLDQLCDAVISLVVRQQCGKKIADPTANDGNGERCQHHRHEHAHTHSARFALNSRQLTEYQQRKGYRGDIERTIAQEQISPHRQILGNSQS